VERLYRQMRSEEAWVDDEARRRFGDFVAHRTPVLIRVPYLLTGDQHADSEGH